MDAAELGHSCSRYANVITDHVMRDRSEAAAPRVLYCTDTYPPQVNGVSVVTALSVAGLRARGGSARSLRRAIRRCAARPGGARAGRESGRDTKRRVSALSRHSTRRAVVRPHRRSHPAFQAGHRPFGDRVHDRSPRSDRCKESRHRPALFVSYGFQPIHRGVRHAVAAAGGVELHRALSPAKCARVYSVRPCARRPQCARGVVGRGVGTRRRHQLVLADAAQPAVARGLRHRRVGGVSTRRPARRRKGRRQDREARFSARATCCPPARRD